MSIGAGMPATAAGTDIRGKFDDLRARVRGRLKPDLVTRALRYGLRRDLNRPLEHVSAKIPISVRPLRDADLDALLPLDAALDPADRQEIGWRRDFVATVGTQGCYVAVDERDGSPAYMQWLFDPSQNDTIAGLGGFPLLSRGEALLENAWTPPSHRGLGIMSAAMALIAERGADVGARHVSTFVGIDNIASLKGCRRAGFDPHMVHTRSYLLFGVLKSDRFDVMADDDPRRRWEMPG